MSNGARTRLIASDRLLMYSKVRIVFGLCSSMSGLGLLEHLSFADEGSSYVATETSEQVLILASVPQVFNGKPT